MMEARHPSEGMPSGRGRADGERSQLVGRVADFARAAPSQRPWRGGWGVRIESGEVRAGKKVFADLLRLALVLGGLGFASVFAGVDVKGLLITCC